MTISSRSKHSKLFFNTACFTSGLGHTHVDISVNKDNSITTKNDVGMPTRHWERSMILKSAHRNKI